MHNIFDFNTLHYTVVNLFSHSVFCAQTRLSKILMIKKEHIKRLKEMNTEAEKLVKSLGQEYLTRS